MVISHGKLHRILLMDILITILLSTIKFGMTFPLAIMEFKFNYFETMLWINIGGIIGIYFFAYLSEGINKWLSKVFISKKKAKRIKEKNLNKKVFSKRNRRIVKIKQRYGLIGIAISTPILLSIPIGVFLVVRYYPKVKSRFLYLIAGNVVWSVFYTTFYMFWNDLLF